MLLKLCRKVLRRYLEITVMVIIIIIMEFKIFVLVPLQGFDPGKDTYQEPPADGSSLSVNVDPKRFDEAPSKSFPLRRYTSV